MLASFEKRLGPELNPQITSIKYCQSSEIAFIEITSDTAVTKTNLDFIGGEMIQEDGVPKEILPLFDPNADIVDNASTLLALDDYSLIMCIDNILTKQGVERILRENKKAKESNK